ncbi:MAG: GNAT family N-acetyltransferase [Bacteroidia bacterium]|nr:GNAT family N-acetyltransferase [Bacteroidia bacterium]
MFDVRRVADAECAQDDCGAAIEICQFGTFIMNHSPVSRSHSFQLSRTQCSRNQVASLLKYVDRKYDQLNLAHRWISGYDIESFANLMPALVQEGYDYQVYWALRKMGPFEKFINPDVEVRQYMPGTKLQAKHLFLREGDDPDSLAYVQMMLKRLGGRELIAYMGRTAVGTMGWYVYQGVARFTFILTHPNYRGLGIATTMIDFALQQEALQQADAIIICANENGPIPLYEQMGFVRNNLMWIFSRMPE